MPAKLSPPPPDQPGRRKPIREQLHEAVNHNIVSMADQGFKEIDRAKRRVIRSLKRNGITGVEEIADAGANLLKAIIAKGLSK